MDQILQFLSPAVNRGVVDRTGLTGRFDLDLEWPHDQLRECKAAADRPPGTLPQINGVPFDPIGPSIFTALREQLGSNWNRRRGQWMSSTSTTPSNRRPTRIRRAGLDWPTRRRPISD